MWSTALSNHAPGTPATKWGVFAADGKYLGETDIPTRYTILEIGRDHLLASVKDSLDAEHVQAFRLRKPGK